MKTETYHILLAEDDEDDRLFFKEAISELKINSELTIVNDGVQLMNYLHQKDVVLPHLLFLDINMPRKNGMKALQEIRNDEKLKDLSVAMYSTSSAQKDIEAALANGANIYINKPSDFDQLKRIITKAVSVNWQYHTSGLNKENFILNIE
jgi:CheY-like chemotaxis protein